MDYFYKSSECNRRAPPKWLIMVALNLHHEDLISYDAVDVLNKMGFQTYANRRFDSQRKHGIKYRPLSY